MNYLLKKTELREIDPKLEEIFNEINTIKTLKKMQVLEIGIGNGNKTIPISNKFKSYYGIEESTQIYNTFLSLCQDHKCNIKSFNMNLTDFINYTSKKFDMIILINTIHFIGVTELLQQASKILKKNGYIIIQNPHEIAYGWGDKKLVQDSELFNESIWLKYKKNLEKCYNELYHNNNLFKFEQNQRFKFFILKINKF
jgi:tRNA G46 methylase TrmB